MTYRIRIGRFSPDRGTFRQALLKSIHLPSLGRIFLLKCCVMTKQESIMQDVYTLAGTDQCMLPEYGPYSYIPVCNSIY